MYAVSANTARSLSRIIAGGRPGAAAFSLPGLCTFHTQAARTAAASAAAAGARTTAAAAAGAGGATMVAATPTAALDVVRVPCLSDNYVWLLRDPTSNLVAVVDPAEVEPVVKELNSRGWRPSYILNTHHHWDHTGGNIGLKELYPGLQVVGPRADADRIPGIDIQVGDGDTWKFGSLDMKVFDTPGHTRGHISLWFPQAEALFCGDTLFALGCGRLFEGDPQTMWTSLSKLKVLPGSTRVYCAHEYTQSNARFAVSVDPNNQQLQERSKAIDAARQQGQPTVPSLLSDELATNPFLRPDSPGVRQGVKAPEGAVDWEVFGLVRRAKDTFK